MQRSRIFWLSTKRLRLSATAAGPSTRATTHLISSTWNKVRVRKIIQNKVHVSFGQTFLYLPVQKYGFTNILNGMKTFSPQGAAAGTLISGGAILPLKRACGVLLRMKAKANASSWAGLLSCARRSRACPSPGSYLRCLGEYSSAYKIQYFIFSGFFLCGSSANYSSLRKLKLSSI